MLFKVIQIPVLLDLEMKMRELNFLIIVKNVELDIKKIREVSYKV